MKKLTIADFVREGSPGSFDHYFSFKETSASGSIEICLEECTQGYCVAIYDGKESLLVDFPKVCTDIPNMMEMQIVPGYSLGSGEALFKAIAIANDIYKRYHALNPGK